MPVRAVFSTDGFLALRLRGADPQAPPRVEARDATLAIVMPGARGEVIVPLPGWIWQVAARTPRGDAVLRCVDGAGRDRIHALSPQRVLDRLAALARDPVESHDRFALVAALEHVHHAGLWPQLTAPLRDFCAAAAAATGLSDFAPAAAARDTPAAAARAGAHDLLKRIGAALRTAAPDEAAAIVRAHCAQAAPDDAARQALMRALTPHFCRIDRVAALHEVLPEAPGGSRPWELAAALPGQALRGEHDTVAQTLAQLGQSPGQWTGPEAVAWTLRHVLQAGPGAGRDAVIGAFLSYLDSQAGRYYGFAPHAALRDAALRVLAARAALPEPLQHRAALSLMRCYGLSPGFWRAVAAQEGPLPAPLPDGQAAFAALLAQPGGAGGIAALQRLARCGAAQAERVQLEFAGPGGAQAPDGAAALRALAAPGARARPELARAAAEAQRAADPDIPHAPGWPEQRAATDAAIALREAARADPGAAHDAALAALAEPLRRLAGTGFYGAGLGVALLADLLAAGAERAAEQLAERLEPLLAQGAGAAMAAHPHMRAAAARLRAHDAAPVRRLWAVLPAELRAVPARAQGVADLSAPALFDALVVVCSSRAGLETRLPALRAGWLGGLAELGIAHLVAVGGERTRRRGDILELAVPDAPGARPRKILALVDWVRRNTDAGHLIKIDDDCELDVAAVFRNQGYRAHAWYGRPASIAPPPFEKLPRAVLHADGSTGYSLDREAMDRLAEIAATPRGQWLTAGAYREDRLLGALLAEVGISPAGTDYATASFRPARPGGVAVAQGAAGVLPDAQGVTKAVHHGAARAATAARRPPGVVLPRRIWPTHAPPRLGHDSNAMQLLSSERRLAAVAAADCAVVAVTRNERAMLDHFLAHYRGLGVGGFLIVDNLSDDGTTERLLAEPDVALFSADTAFRAAMQGTDWKVALMAHYRVGRWTLVADADELLLYPGMERARLPAYLAGAAFAGADAVRVHMLDMYPRGPLAGTALRDDPFAEAGHVDRDPFRRDSLARGPFGDSPTWTSAVRHRLMPGARPEQFVTQKIALVKYAPWMRFSTSLHYAAEIALAVPELVFAHFKYHAAFHAKAEREIARGQYYNNAEEYRMYRELLASGGGVIFDPAVSVPWRDCDAVRALLGG